MLRTVSRLSTYSSAILASSGPAGCPKNVLKPTILNGKRITLPSRPVLYQLSTGASPVYTFTPSMVSGLTTKMSDWILKSEPSLLAAPAPATTTQTRSVVKWSLQKGKRKSVKAVLKRFKRFDWGGRSIWIHARSGAKKRMWKKSPSQRRRCKTHVFCNATQSQLLDKMVRILPFPCW
ncbi:39S ribosomal protein L35-like [Homarus americanus]|uniref:Large ribosomal subunit protein bL35m n=1 Tax=Homarus americanus TaxID=6706 RepID=A0A8J5N752_HOMAM|nr:39S ribosomal protein L35-like [Homarus americanus]